ncbi:MAG: glycosyltransferase 87 family protein [Stellaceae bacterium]
MAATYPSRIAPEASRRWACRLAIPAAALLLLGGLAVLWRWGPHALYVAALRLFGFEPFRFPFLDIHFVLAGAQCQRLGIDVYLSDPCDALGRVHNYSPLWLAITPGFLDTTTTTAVGLGLDLIWILSLIYVIRPAGFGEVMILGFVALSPMTVYALERANCDLVIFLLVVGGCALARASRPWRFGGYGLYLLAGLLKYYPLVLMALLMRERRRDALIGAGTTAVIVLGLAGLDHADLATALANIPALSYFADSFSARNLPFGVAGSIFGPRLRGAAGLLLLAVLAALAAARAWRTLHLLDPAALDPDLFEGQLLLVGALLVTACFFAGQNVDYRGIFFVLIMPGLVRLRRTSDDRTIRRFLARMIAAVLFVAWAAPLRELVHRNAEAIVGVPTGLRVKLLFWLGRELVWWWLIAGLAAIILGCAARMPIWPGRRARGVGPAAPLSAARRRRGARGDEPAIRPAAGRP